MKRYFFFALIVVSASVTSISAFATCPMAVAQAGMGTQVAGVPASGITTPMDSPPGMAPALAAPAGPPPGFVMAQPKQNLPQ